ncbi:MAG: hypothetical protein AB4911_14305 [Oscillochloridaceae bacterium umkhey_bin13]
MAIAEACTPTARARHYVCQQDRVPSAYGGGAWHHCAASLGFAELRLSDELRRACDELVPPGSAVVNFHNSAAWMRQTVSITG